MGAALRRACRALARRRGANAAALDLAQRYAAWATLSPAGREKHRRGVLFKVPHRLDMHHLVPVETIERDGVTMLHLPEHDWRAARRLCADRPRHRPHRRARPGELLHLVPQPGQGQLLARAQGEGRRFKNSVFGVTLAGCPLEEKISEMNLVKARGYSSARWPSSPSTTRCARRPGTASATIA